VVGLGCSTKWGEHYSEDPKTWKERKKKEESLEVKELRAKVDQIPQIVQEQVDNRVADQVALQITALLPSLLEGLGNWHAGGRQGPPPVPSMVGSNSNNAVPNVLVTPPANIATPDVLMTSPANTAAPELNAPDRRENTPAVGNAPASNPSISCTPVVGGPSTLAELDAIKVTKGRRLN
jgi:hypothetical protein